MTRESRLARLVAPPIGVHEKEVCFVSEVPNPPAPLEVAMKLEYSLFTPLPKPPNPNSKRRSSLPTMMVIGCRDGIIASGDTQTKSNEKDTPR
jgi:hypothetical protein